MELNNTEPIDATALKGARAVGTHRKARLTSTSAIALAAIAAAAILIPARAEAADCADDVNPAGTTCETSLKQLDNLVSTYDNKGTFNNSHADGVVIKDAAAQFANTGTFNNTLAGSLNFAAAGAFVNKGIFNSTADDGIIVNTATATFTNNGVFNNISIDTFNPNGNAINFNNNAGAVFNSFGGNIDLGGVGGTFANAGILNLGANSSVGTATTIKGNLEQTSAGSLRLRMNWGTGAIDNLTITMNAQLAGTVLVNYTNVIAGTLTQTQTFINVTGTLTDNGLRVQNTAAVTNALTVNPNDIQLTSTINFMGSGTQVTGNAAAMARTINTMFTGGATQAFVTNLLNVATTAEYVRALQSLGPVADARGATSTLATSNTFANQMLSCRVPGEGDAYAVIREGQCAWVRATGRRGDTGSSDSGPGVSSSSFMISTGAQFNVGGPWRVGGGIAYEDASSNSAIARSDAQRVHLGAIVKYNPGPWLIALALNGGFGNSDNKRFATFGGFTGTATSSNDTDYISGRLTTAYLMPLGSFYLKPQMDIAQTYINRGGYSESATGGIGLTVASSSLSVWSYAPSIELGMQTRIANNNIVRPYAKIGGTWQDKGSVSTTASFTGVAGSTFTMTSSMDRAFLDLGGGLDVISTDGSVLRLQLDGQYGENTTSTTGSAKFSVKF